jgi:hypothetical protein
MRNMQASRYKSVAACTKSGTQVDASIAQVSGRQVFAFCISRVFACLENSD